ncbi:AzlD domain-containing protein [Streptomyces mobaraensis NBRC 13819 = DSM 40847]|uniref:Branched-chain amino acid ABC transporter n=2 Tax=Streptomyces mobaraensis TaxID=35621 RepID=A0A5N5W8N0_STRMB|nr:AzlD domain-containing protein [Streptomyces mobaraensis]EME99402.1 branched-chain amino acid permease [Streptomyces mobaraensis NBRC 13819 = DSM 40847]KAB7845659.1 branched-chain amino acid ABC transporter [Streptomyces mobaraensis]QTT77119.1 AzlD domain-containing protein [Streptomyces mobaraensis NBRC 13819 = DSM 40847]
MPDTGYLIAAVATAVAVTWALRALPFAALAPLRSSPLVVYLRKAMPVGVMVVLAVYTLRDFDPHVPDRAWPTVIALAFTVALHLWRRNLLLSVLAGTVVHVLLASAVFG